MIGNSRWGQAFLGAALASLGVIAHGQDSGASTVYRCHGVGGAIEYRDYPCKGGAVVDMKPGEADPAAIARLQRSQAEFDRALARRRMLEDADRRAEEAARAREVPPPYLLPDAYFPDETYLPAFDYYAPFPPARDRADRRPPKERDRTSKERRVPAVIRRPRPG
jgi:hypothetical protein